MVAEPTRLWTGTRTINGMDREIEPSANLGGADLRGANLRGANLWGANLKGADLRDADLWDADLWCAGGNRYTVLPADYEVTSSGLIVRK